MKGLAIWEAAALAALCQLPTAHAHLAGRSRRIPRALEAYRRDSRSRHGSLVWLGGLSLPPLWGPG